jgi:hypothetical protein
MEQAGVTAHVSYEVADVSGIPTMIELVERGEGHTFLPFHHVYTKAIGPNPALACRPVVLPELFLPLHLVRAHPRPMSRPVQLILKALGEFVPERLREIEAQRKIASSELCGPQSKLLFVKQRDFQNAEI